MIDQNSKFFAILTAIGEAKQANADALGIAWLITQMGVGDANDTDPLPDRLQTRLINERRRAPLNQLVTDPKNPGLLMAEQVIPADVGGWWVREVGLYDADGDLIAISNCAPSYKPLLSQGSGRTQVVRMTFIISSTANILLKIDPSVVIATRDYVDRKVLEELDKLDFKHSVLVATTRSVVLAGLYPIDDTPISAATRILVKDQEDPKEHGIWLTADGPWSRARDADDDQEVTPGLFVHVEEGSANGDSVWQLVTDAPIILGATDLGFEIVSGRSGVAVGSYRNVSVDKLGRVIAGTNPTTAEGYGLAEDLAWPLSMMPSATIATEELRVLVTARMEGKVSVLAGQTLCIGEDVVAGKLARPRMFTTADWTSPQLLENEEYFLRAHVVGGELSFYMQRGTVFDAVPMSLKGIPGGSSGGGFISTALDLCIARIQIGAAGTLPVVHRMYSSGRTTWAQMLNGTGVAYLPLDPHVRSARLVVANPVPAIDAVSSIVFETSNWLGGNYIYMTPGSQSIASMQGWGASRGVCGLMSNNVVNDVTVSTLTASFDHKEARSLWQCYQTEHTLGDVTAISDELLFSMGIKNHPQTDYDNGIAINFSSAVNMQLTWEVIR
jgi:hypothetical protein